MKILLVNPNSSFLISEKVFPSIGLLYLSAYLKKNGFCDVSLIDMNEEEPLPKSIDADVVGFYSCTPQFPAVAKLIHKLRERNRRRDALYVIGGPHISGKPEDMPEGCDTIVIGEGEQAMLDIVRNKEAGKAPAKIVRFDYIKDIDSIPFPDRDLIDIKSYHYYLNGLLTTTVITSRGCPFGCYFCANNAWGKSLRMRSPANVYEEVKMLKEKYGYKAFMFFDDTMTVNRKRMKEICSLLGSLEIIYRCFIRSDTVDPEIMRMMEDSGCIEVGIGIESGSQRILDIANKGETVRRNLDAVKMCHGAGIRAKGFLIVGLPGENHESVRETIAFLEEADLDDLDISIFKPYPGSHIYKNREKFDIKFSDDYEHAWYKGRPHQHTTNISTSALEPGDILRYRDEIEQRFKRNKICIEGAQ